MFLHQSVVDDEGRERNRREAHAAEVVFPVPDFLGGELDVSSFDVV